MLALRPIVVDEGFNILGGNMRYQALVMLAKEGATCPIIDKDGAETGIFKFSQDIPDEWVTQATDLTPEEKMEFIINDNQERGQWDYDKIANEWDAKKLKAWDVPAAEWDTNFVKPGTDAAPSTSTNDTDIMDYGGEENLPEELQGIDLTPNDLPKLTGDDQTAYERIIITFRNDQRQLLMDILGVKNLDKVLFSLDELVDWQANNA